MQSTTRFHHGITNAIFQEADFVFHDSVAFHPTNGMFNTNSDGGNPLIGRLLRRGEFSARWGFLGLDDRDARQEKSLEALLVRQATAGWQGIACQLCNALLRGFAFTGMAQEAHVTRLVDHEEVFERVTRLLATIKLLLLFGIFRAVDRTFSAIMPTRGVLDLPSAVCGATIAANSADVRAGSSF
jgi:hypothetical protein